jgi:ABC-type sugar transport system substrate-binding protein
MIPKLIGIDFFNAAERGAQEAADELDGVELICDGPTEASVEDQVEMIEMYTDRGVDVLAVACNDPNAVADSLQRAVDKGITVITWDSDADPEASGRAFFVNQARPRDLAETLIDEMARQAGEDANIVIISSTPTATNQNTWIEHMRDYMNQEYPDMTEAADIQYPGEDQQAATMTTQDVLKANPAINGVIGLSSNAFPGATQAVVDQGLEDEVAVVGLGTPNAMRAWIDRGEIDTTVLWDVVELGYLAVYVGQAVARGELSPGDESFDAGRLGEVAVEGDEVILGEPMVFTKETVGDYEF